MLLKETKFALLSFSAIFLATSIFSFALKVWYVFTGDACNKISSPIPMRLPTCNFGNWIGDGISYSIFLSVLLFPAYLIIPLAVFFITRYFINKSRIPVPKPNETVESTANTIAKKNTYIIIVVSITISLLLLGYLLKLITVFSGGH